MGKISENKGKVIAAIEQIEKGIDRIRQRGYKDKYNFDYELSRLRNIKHRIVEIDNQDKNSLEIREQDILVNLILFALYEGAKDSSTLGAYKYDIWKLIFEAVGFEKAWNALPLSERKLMGVDKEGLKQACIFWGREPFPMAKAMLKCIAEEGNVSLADEVLKRIFSSLASDEAKVDLFLNLREWIGGWFSEKYKASKALCYAFATDDTIFTIVNHFVDCPLRSGEGETVQETSK